MARCVQDCELSIFGAEKPGCHLNSDATFALLIRLIHDVGKLKARLRILLAQFFVFADVLL